MTTPALPVFQDGVMVNAQMLNALVANVEAVYEAAMGVPSGGGYLTANKPQVVLTINSATSACTTSFGNSSRTPGPVVWDTAIKNTDAMWVSGSAITVQTAGTYRLAVQLTTADTATFNSSGGRGIHLYILVNGTVYTTYSIACHRQSYGTAGRVSAIASLTPGAVIYVYALYDYSSSGSKFWATGYGGCRFEAIRIGPA